MPIIPDVDNIPSEFRISGFGFEELQVLIWNGRGTVMRDPEQRSTMGNQLISMSKHAKVICLQEVHGLHFDVVAQLLAWLPQWTCFHSPCVNVDGTVNGNAGGDAILVCQSLGAVANCNPRFIVPGRCIGISILVGARF